MNNNDPEYIEHAAIEVKRPSRFPCLIKKIAMACFVSGAIFLLVLSYYSYAVLTSKMTQLEKQIAALPETVAALAPKPQPVTSDQSVTPVEHNASSLDIEEEKNGIDSRQHELLTMIVAVSELREAARRGIPYYKELMILEESDDPVIAEKITLIEPYAQSGIKNIATLREGFKEVSGAIKGAGEATQKDNGNLSALTKQFISLIKIRKINESTETGTSTEAVVMRAEKALTDADIPKAIAELNQLQDEEIKKLSAAWISDAENSLEAIEESEALYQHVIKLPLKGQTP